VKPTIVLVHGAFAESASWGMVIESLTGTGYRVIAAANPLRGLAADAAAVTDLVRTIDGPVMLVGHSYGGMVISNIPADAGEITGLVYVCAFAPEPGETCFTLAGKFPGSTLGQAVRPVQLSDGKTDLYIDTEKFHHQFCADLSDLEAGRMAATQRPVTQEALTEPSGGRPLWREVPSWFVIGEEDRNIPAELQRFMAERAEARRVVQIPRASHAVAVSRPGETAQVIRAAAAHPSLVRP
jgi:pimeloyl-ACP methyl ester carboxylesterase